MIKIKILTKDLMQDFLEASWELTKLIVELVLFTAIYSFITAFILFMWWNYGNISMVPEIGTIPFLVWFWGIFPFWAVRFFLRGYL